MVLSISIMCASNMDTRWILNDCPICCVLLFLDALCADCSFNYFLPYRHSSSSKLPLVLILCFSFTCEELSQFLSKKIMPSVITSCIFCSKLMPSLKRYFHSKDLGRVVPGKDNRPIQIKLSQKFPKSEPSSTKYKIVSQYAK